MSRSVFYLYYDALDVKTTLGKIMITWKVYTSLRFYDLYSLQNENEWTV